MKFERYLYEFFYKKNTVEAKEIKKKNGKFLFMVFFKN